MQPKHLIQLIFLAAIWGASFLFMRVAAPEFGAFALVLFRCTIGALCLLPLLYFSKEWLNHKKDIKQHWHGLLLVGFFNTAMPFTLLAYTAIMVSAGFTSILNAFTPMFAAIIAFIWLKDKLSIIACFGLLIGFLGVLFLILDKQNLTNEIGILPILTGMFATIGYGIASCYSRKYLKDVKPLITTAISQLFAALMILPFAIAYLPNEIPSMAAWINAIILAVFSTALAFVMFFNLIKEIGVTKTVAVTYLIPIFSITWGWLFLEETLTMQMLAATACIFVGISLMNGLITFRKKNTI